MRNKHKGSDEETERSRGGQVKPEQTHQAPVPTDRRPTEDKESDVIRTVKEREEKNIREIENNIAKILARLDWLEKEVWGLKGKRHEEVAKADRVGLTWGEPPAPEPTKGGKWK